jgi:hypothetical protein
MLVNKRKMNGTESAGIQGKICRLCLSDAGIILPIFDGEVAERFSVPLPMKILACVSIEVSNVIRYTNRYTDVKRTFFHLSLIQ